MQRLERLLRRCRRGDALERGHAFGAGPVGRLGQHRLAGLEVGVEAAMGQAGVLHDVGHAGAAVAAAPDGARGGVHDALVGGFLAAGVGRLLAAVVI